MRTDDLRLLTAALVLLLTGAFLTTPAKADERPAHCAFGPHSSRPTAAHKNGAPHKNGTARKDGPERAHGSRRTGHTDRTAHWTAPTVRYRLSARYAARGRLWRHRHTGQDFAVHTGTPVYAVGPGRVVAATCGDAFGNQVVLHHPDGYYTQYAHLSVINVRRGQRVSAGQRIGAAGATGNADGPHLHFEVRTTRHLGSEVPPLPWLRHHGVSVPGTPTPAHHHPAASASPTPTASATPTRSAAPPTDRPTSTPSPRPVKPAAHARPHATPVPAGTPAPVRAPARQWVPTGMWDPTTVWDLSAR
ncbi:peptidoglycan DD-metalloendopeptidase family protein [Streptomyces sp. NBC_00631]|uniref:M23 family metallopeptidase n=1 Tax=Streptomyces sp. NBC_00631 TaxID=2975793 RepID=UPI00386F60F9